MTNLIYNINTIKLSDCETSHDLEAKYKQNTYSVKDIYTRGSRQDWKEDDDEESESVEEEAWRGQSNLVILQAASNYYNQL